jgi:ethanolamine utilization microcompartment shell protein EutS
MARDFFPRRNVDALRFSANFLAKVVLRPAHFGLKPAQVAQYAVLQQAFAAQQQLASDPSTSTQSRRTARNEAREVLEDKTRTLVNLVRAHPGIDAQSLKDLGLEQHHRGRGPRTPRPSEAPLVHVDKVIATTVHLRLMDAVSGKRRKPRGVDVATVFGYVGEHPPDKLGDWLFMAKTTRTLTQVTFQNAGPIGSKLWIAVRWENTRCQPGPVCAPVMTRVQDGVVMPANAILRRAA